MNVFPRMSINAKMIIFAAFAVVAMSAVAMFVSTTNNSDVAQAVQLPQEPQAPIGGNRDDYGCLGPAGYSWDKDADACIRTWELSEIEKQAARVAVEYVGSEEGITIIQAQKNECIGCFTVEVEKGRDRTEVIIRDYEVVSASTTTF